MPLQAGALWLLLHLAPSTASANILADRKEGCVELIVNFQPSVAQSANESYAWDFGNNKTASTYRGIGIYQTAGTYTVTLRITNTTTNATQTFTTTVTAHNRPVVDIGADATEGCFPHSVNFRNRTQTGAGSIQWISWYFGDGTTSGSSDPQHTYRDNASVYPVTLRVVQSACPLDTFENKVPLTIRVTEGVRPDFFTVPPTICKPPVNMQFRNATPAVPGSTITYRWDFEGGTPSSSTDPNPVVQFGAAGKYKATLTAISSKGCQDSRTETIDIPSVSVVADFTMDGDTVCQGVVAQFINNSTPTPTKSTWYFGSAPAVTGINQFRSFPNAGEVTVKLVENFGGCEATVEKKIYVKPGPIVDFTSSNRFSCKAPHTVNINYSGTSASDITKFDWDFGDGTKTSTTTPTVSHTYNSQGKYAVLLTVSSRTGCTNRKFIDSFVLISEPVLTGSLVDSGCAGLVFQPQQSKTALDKPWYSLTAFDGVSSYVWEFGAGAPSNAANPSFTFGTPRTDPYPVELRVTTTTGCTAKLTGSVRIGSPPGAAAFDAIPRQQCTGKPVAFYDKSANPSMITGWRWEFGDGSKAFEKNPSHVYNDTGSFQIKLWVYNNGCAQAPTIVNDFISINGPISKFQFKADCAGQNQFQFFNLSRNAVDFTWDFGDGTAPVNQQTPPPHAFPGLGTYKVSLTARSQGCEITSAEEVKVVAAPADFTYKSVFAGSLCKGTVMQFDAVGSDPATVTRYEWDFGMGGGFVQRNRSTTESYNENGSFTPRLRVTDINGCSVVVSKGPFTIGGPKAGFDADIRQGCKGLLVTFTDTSSTLVGSRIVSRTWEFGDGNTASPMADVLKVSNKYLNGGSYNVKLKVVDEKGCEDTMRLNKYIVITDPLIEFQSPDRQSCPGALVRFVNQTKMTSGTFSWDFGDGGTSTDPNPRHAYAASGKYTVSLKAKDLNGCEASRQEVEFISVDVPFAAFDVDQDYSPCPPLKPTFTFKGRYQKEVRWEFGDGAVSSQMNPLQLYQYPGEYTAKLTVISPGGCTAEATRKITIRGPIGTLVKDRDFGCDTTPVRFSLKDYNDVDSVIWDFDDGVGKSKVETVTHYYVRGGVYRPRIILKNVLGCTVSYPVRDSITIIGTDPGFRLSNEVLCDKGTITFTDTSKSTGVINSWQWDFGNGQTSTVQNPGTVSYLTPGAYNIRLRLRTAEGCERTLTRQNLVRVVRTPSGTIQGVTALCQNDSALFTGVETTVPKDTSVLRWRWDFGNGQTSDLQRPSPQKFPSDGSYTVRLTITNSSGCSSSADQSVTVNPLPSIALADEETICLGAGIPLNASGADSWEWFNTTAGLSCTACANPTANPLQTTRYHVRGTSRFGCRGTDSILIKVIQPSKVVADPNYTLCLGDTLRFNASGTEVYSWSPANNLSDTRIRNPLAWPTATTTYTVTGSDSKNCFPTQATVTVTVHPIPVVNAGPDKVILSGSSNQLQATYSSDVLSLLWAPALGLSCTTCPNPVASPKKTTVYKLTATNAGGCNRSDNVTLTVLCTDGNLFMPNTFSPNGDGMNDVYYPRGIGIFAVRSLRIFNRWGEMVYARQNFSANDPGMGWDGTFRGSPLTPDVYVYLVEIICDNQSLFTQKGDIFLAR